MQMNLSPDVDINNNPKTDYQLPLFEKTNNVAVKGAYLKGMGWWITGYVKHFPGHGDTDGIHIMTSQFY
ncbi:hypothetical protein CS542_08510 [Pedobacter sp. IW39]|nr:hypothetical protein CS542_08510 [Pedobacter sp. IW39]